MIEVKNLTKYYADRCAVRDLSFSVQKGQIVGLLGPNGAGKSTTMNMLTGYIAPSEGSITIEGYDIMEQPLQARMQIGYLPEIPPLYQDMKVKEYLSYVAQLRKIKKSELSKEIEYSAQQAGVSDVMDRLIRNLSKGYRQRVGLAAALVGHPPFLILDEPTVGLDPKQMIEMRQLIRSLGKEHTVLLSSHILSEVSAVCDHILIVSGGKLVAQGTPQQLQERMCSGVQVDIKVLGDKQKAQTIISSNSFVKGITQQSEKDGIACFTIDMEDSVQAKAEISLKLAQENCPVIEMIQNNMSLEDIFLQLTENTSDENEDISQDSEEDTQEAQNESDL